MRFTFSSLFAAVSMVALVAVSASAAPSKTENFGKLTSQDVWRVGTIDTEGAPYCAMVNKYDKGVFLAFARDADGFGSVAIDFSEGKFTSGTDYEATLTPAKGKASTFEAHASSDRSVVIQIGKDEGFYQALGKADTLDASLPTMKLSFAMKSFAGAYEDLVGCAGNLYGSAPKVAAKVDPSQSPLTVASKDEGKTKIASAAAVKDPGVAAMEAELKKEQKIEAAQSKAAIDWFDDKKEDLGDKLAAEKKAAENIAQEKKTVERKLLASVSAGQARVSSPEVSAPPAKSVQDMEREQLAAIRDRKLVETAIEAAGKSATASTPLLIEKRVGDTSKPVESVSAVPTQAKDTPKEQTKVAAVAEKVDVPAKAEPQQAPLSMNAPADKKREAESQDQFEAALAGKKEEASAPVVAGAAAVPAALSEKLAKAEKSRAATDAELKKLFAQKKQDSDAVASLRKKLADQTAARDAVQKEIDALNPQLASAAAASPPGDASFEKMSAPPEMPAATAPVVADAGVVSGMSVPPAEDPALKKLNDDLAKKQASIASMEAEMKKVEDARKAEAERSAKAQADLATARQHIDMIKKGETPAKPAPAAKQSAAEAALAMHAMPAVPSTPVAQEVIGAPAVQSNRASAFLDRIMSHHRPAGVSVAKTPANTAPLPVPTADEKAFMAVLSAKPIAPRAAPVTAPASAPVAAAPAPVVQPAPAIPETKIAAVKPPVAPPPAPAAVQMSQPPVMAAAVKPEVKTPDVAATQKISAPLPVEPKDLSVPPSADPSREMKDMIAKVADEPVEDVTEKIAPKAAEKSAVKESGAAPVKTTEAKIEEPTLFAPGADLTFTPSADPVIASAPASASSMPIDLSAGLPSPYQPETLSKVEPPATRAPMADKALEKKQAEKVSAPAALVSPAQVAKIDMARSADLSVPPPMPPAVAPTMTSGAETTAGKISAPPAVSGAPARAPVSVAMTSPRDLPPAVAEKPAAVEKPVALDAPVNEFVAPPKAPLAVSAAPAAPQAAVAAVPAGVLTLDGLLQQSGQQNTRFAADTSAPGEVVRQWKSGNLNGLFEQTPDGGGNFKVAMENYLDRYREDCPGHLDVTVGEIRTVRAGTVAPAAISCKAAANAYSTAFVFVQDAGKFNAIAHSGRPGQTADVKVVSDRLVGTLVNAQRFLPPEPSVKAPVAASTAAAVPAAAPAAAVSVPQAAPVPQAAIVPAPAQVAAPEILAEPSGVVRLNPPQAAAQPQKQLRFKMFDKPEAKHPGDEFATVVIE